MTDFLKIPYKMGAFSSAQIDAQTKKPINQLFNQSLPAEERVLGSATRRILSGEGVFAYEAAVKRIRAAEIGTDMTTVGLRWEIFLRHKDGGYTVLPVVEGTRNIVRGGKGEGAMQFSTDNPTPPKVKEGWVIERNVQDDALDFTLPEPVNAIAVYICIRGHGWFRIVALDCYGEKVGEISDAQMADLREDLAEDMRHFWEA